jgi:hypothetical protein
MKKPKLETDMENYINNMTEEEFTGFLEDTGYDYYKNVKTSFLGLKGLEPQKDDNQCP